MDTLSIQKDIHDDITPGGSPFTERKLYDFLTINGNFESDEHHPSSNGSTASSSLCPSPYPPGYELEIEKNRRFSLSPLSVTGTPSDELNQIKEDLITQNRRHSVLADVTAPTTEQDTSTSDNSDQISPSCSKLSEKSKNYKNTKIIPAQIQDLNGNFRTEEIPGSSKLYPNCDVNVWLRSCIEEVIEPIEGVVKGNIPRWINGALLRNGPGNLKFGDTEFKHLFDSSGLLHRFGIKNGNVTYQCRFIESNIYMKNKAANRIVVTEFGTSSVPDPCQSIFSRVSTLFSPGENTSDNTMISIYPFGDEYFSFTENPVIHKINPITLETVERKNLYHSIGIVNHSAHPHVLRDGTVYNLGMTVTKTGPSYVIICFPAGDKMFEKAHIVASVPVRWNFHPGYMHSFGITENYFILVEQPLSVSVPTMVKNQLTNRPLCTALKWFSDKETCIYLLDRRAGTLKYKFYTESFFYLHIINQYEKDNHIILDICCYKDPSMLNCMYIDSMKKMQTNPDYAKMFRGKPLRFVLPLIENKSNFLSRSISWTGFNTHNHNNNFNYNENNNNLYNRDDLNSSILGRVNSKKSGEGKCIRNIGNLVTLNETKATAYRLSNNIIFCKPELITDVGCETPRIDYDSVLGKEYQYFYAISSDVDADNPGTLIKVDLKNKTKKLWCETNVYPSEPIFIPNPNQKSEDDGVVLAAMVWGNGQENRVGLLALCAITWTELGRCEFITPGPTPKCLHGWFAPSK